MEDMEKKLGAVLGNPKMMEQIMQLAQNLGADNSATTPKENSESSQPAVDPGLLQKLSGLAGSSRIDPKEQQLLKALRPYISSQRLNKLERAMRAAKMASIATAFLGTGR